MKIELLVRPGGFGGGVGWLKSIVHRRGLFHRGLSRHFGSLFLIAAVSLGWRFPGWRTISRVVSVFGWFVRWPSVTVFVPLVCIGLFNLRGILRMIVWILVWPRNFYIFWNLHLLFGGANRLEVFITGFFSPIFAKLKGISPKKNRILLPPSMNGFLPKLKDFSHISRFRKICCSWILKIGEKRQIYL